MYVTTQQAENIDLPTSTTKCSCGESLCLVNEQEQINIIVCDECHDHAANYEKY